jgi:uncharacterized protein YgiM (DUF1202 family)
MAAVMLAAVLLFTGVVPANAEYHYQGNQAISQGNVSVEDAVLLNSLELTVQVLSEITGIPLSVEDLLTEATILVLMRVNPKLALVLEVIDMSRIAVDAWMDLAQAWNELSAAQQKYYSAVMANVKDYLIHTSETVEAIKARAERDARNGTALDPAFFDLLDRHLDGSELAARIRDDANQPVFKVDSEAKKRLLKTADAVEKLGNKYRKDGGAREIYRIARQQAEKKIQSERRIGVVERTFKSGLKLRATPAKDAKQIGSLFDGYVVTVIGGVHPDGYYKVDYKGKVGWVTAEYVKIVDESIRRKGVVYNTFKSGLKLRATPTKDAKQIGSLFDGYEVTVIGDGPANGYYYVEYKGKTGWVTADYIKISPNQTKNKQTT